MHISNGDDQSNFSNSIFKYDKSIRNEEKKIIKKNIIRIITIIRSEPKYCTINDEQDVWTRARSSVCICVCGLMNFQLSKI